MCIGHLPVCGKRFTELHRIIILVAHHSKCPSVNKSSL
jgi:hypothetical protein